MDLQLILIDSDSDTDSDSDYDPDNDPEADPLADYFNSIAEDRYDDAECIEILKKSSLLLSL